MKKGISYLLLIVSFTVIFSSCTKDTCECEKNDALLRQSMDRAGLHVENDDVVKYKIGETVWDVSEEKLEVNTKESIEKLKSKLEAEGYKCEWK